MFEDDIRLEDEDLAGGHGLRFAGLRIVADSVVFLRDKELAAAGKDVGTLVKSMIVR